jgi:hypothetical protein
MDRAATVAELGIGLAAAAYDMRDLGVGARAEPREDL